MATYTRLSLSATPGRPYLGFVAKAEAIPASGPHIGLFTALSVTVTPGPIHSFLAKTPYVPGGGVHTGRFTALSVLGLPGGVRVFSAKTAAEAGGGYSGVLDTSYGRLRRDDQEIMDIIVIITESGILQ